MKKNWLGISVISCAAAATLTLGMTWKKQHEKVQLELGERDAKHWIENLYERQDRIKELDKQSKMWAAGTVALVSWPFFWMFCADVRHAEERAKIRRLRKKMAQRQK